MIPNVFYCRHPKNAKKVDLHYFGGEVPRKKKNFRGWLTNPFPNIKHGV